MIHIFLLKLEFSVTFGTGIDIGDPDRPATNALHLAEWPGTRTAVDTGPEMASQSFETTTLTY